MSEYFTLIPTILEVYNIKLSVQHVVYIFASALNFQEIINNKFTKYHGDIPC